MRILLVDDNAEMRELFQTILTDAGHEVVTAINGVSALFTYRTLTNLVENKDHFDFVLSDYQMPQKNGVSLLQDIKELNPNQRFALISAHPPRCSLLPETLKDLVILEKPVRIAELLDAINKK